jgi:hypothetical protein
MEAPGQSVFVRLSAEQGLPEADRELLELALPGGGFHLYTIQSRGAAHLRVLALPVLSSVRPTAVFNLAAVSSLTVRGENFHSSEGGLVCLLAAASSSHPVQSSKATYKSSTEALCPFSPPASLLREHTLVLSISNDGGLTQSEHSLGVFVASSLPRIQELVSPRVLIAGSTVSLLFKGTGLGGLGSVVQLWITKLAERGAGGILRASASCTPSLDGTNLACSDVLLPACSESSVLPLDGCSLGLSLIAQDADPATEVRQSLTLATYAAPTILELSP